METLKKKKYLSVNNATFKVADRNTADKIINAVIFESCSKVRGHKTWAYTAQEWLEKEFGIIRTISSLRQIMAKLTKGTRDSRAASCFSGKISTRAEKDGMYRELELLVEFSHTTAKMRKTSYIGLPANQILHVLRTYTDVVACEQKDAMIDFMKGMVSRFSLDDDPQTVVQQEDILDFLLKTNNTFSVYDIDLMSYINKPGVIDKIAKGVARTSKKTSVVCVVSCCGRRITQQQYREIMPQKLITRIKHYGEFDIAFTKSGGYTDQITPMRYELLVLKRK